MRKIGHAVVKIIKILIRGDLLINNRKMVFTMPNVIKIRLTFYNFFRIYNNVVVDWNCVFALEIKNRRHKKFVNLWATTDFTRSG